jgi:hypothetical protein
MNYIHIRYLIKGVIEVQGFAMMLILNKTNIYHTFRLDLVHVYFIMFRIQNPKHMDACGI